MAMTQPDPTAWALLEQLDDAIAEPTPDAILNGPLIPIPDAHRANVLLRRMTRLADNGDRVGSTSQAEIDRITTWRDEQLAAIERERAYLDRCLEGFMRQHHAATRETSMSLPNGKLSLRKGGTKTIVDDEAALIEWATTNAPDAIKRTPLTSKLPESDMPVGDTVPNADGIRVDRAPMVTKADGEIIPGVHVETPTDKVFAAKPGVS